MNILLVALVFFPIVVSPLFALMQRRNIGGLVSVAYGVAFIEILLAGLCWLLIPTTSIMVPVVRLPWISDLGIFLSLGWDQFSQMMVFLTMVSVPVVIATTALDTTIQKKGYFFALLFALQTALLGVFSCLDLFGFYVFWELSLIPAYFMVLCWGGAGISKVTLKFFVYTFAGSLLMLLAFVYLFVNTPQPHSFLSAQMSIPHMPLVAQVLVCLALLIAFAIKTPIFPFHTWQPDTYQKSAIPVAMVLGGLLSKLGIVGIFRILIPVMPTATSVFAPYIISFSLAGMVYGAAMAFVQTDLRRMIAYASISHLGLLVAGAVSLTIQGFEGAMFQIVAHAITTIGMFFIAQLLIQKVGSTEISALGGLNRMNRLFSAGFFVLLLAMVGFPLTVGFVGEFLLLWGVSTGPIFPLVLGPIAVSTLVFGAWYMLKAYHSIMYGEARAEHVSVSFKASERLLLIVLIGVVLTLGVYPKPIMNFATRYVQQMTEGTNSQ